MSFLIFLCRRQYPVMPCRCVCKHTCFLWVLTCSCLIFAQKRFCGFNTPYLSFRAGGGWCNICPLLIDFSCWDTDAPEIVVDGRVFQSLSEERRNSLFHLNLQKAIIHSCSTCRLLLSEKPNLKIALSSFESLQAGSYLSDRIKKNKKTTAV